MSRLKLQALQYPKAQGFDPNDRLSFRSLVSWLEDQAIRLYAPGDRGALRAVADDARWPPAFAKYLSDTGCPHSATDEPSAVAEWLLGYAVRAEYAERAAELNAAAAEGPEGGNSPKRARHDNPLDELDVKSPSFVAGVAELCSQLGVAPHPDPLVRLAAAADLVEGRLGKDAPKDQAASPKNALTMEQVKSLGGESSDAVVAEAAGVLRLLHVARLRDLQTRINEAIVAVQAITADPKTNDKLGKVGYG